MQAETKNESEFPNVNVALDLEETTADRIKEVEALRGKARTLCVLRSGILSPCLSLVENKQFHFRELEGGRLEAFCSLSSAYRPN